MPGLQIFKSLKQTYGLVSLKNARKWESYARKESSTLEQLHFLHNCKRLNILPNSINYRPPMKTELAKRTAKTNGKRMLRTLITETHNCLRIYRGKRNSHRHEVLNSISLRDSNALKDAIEHTSKDHRAKRHMELELKLNTRHYRFRYNNNTDAWVKNISKRQLTENETRVLAKRHELQHTRRWQIRFYCRTIMNNQIKWPYQKHQEPYTSPDNQQPFTPPTTSRFDEDGETSTKRTEERLQHRYSTGWQRTNNCGDKQNQLRQESS